MNSKMLVGFVGGLILASGITYMVMRKQAGPAATPVPAAPQTAIATPPGPTGEPDALPVAESAPAQEPVSKPSPVVARKTPVVRPEPVSSPVASARVAQAAPAEPVTPATPAPAPEPTPPVVATHTEPTPAPPPPPPPPQPASVTIPRGTILNVRLGETLSSERNNAGDRFSGVLDLPLIVDGFAVAERGARVEGRIAEIDRSGRVKGVARLALELTRLHTSDGQNVRLVTSAFIKQAESTAKRDAAKVGIGAAVGAAIGAIAGGGKGAGIGAGVGGAAGAGDVLLTRGAPAELRVESRISFRLSEPLTLTEQLR